MARDDAEIEAPKKILRGKRKFSIRPLLRAVHRDIGYVAVGLTFIYALSGLAVNHIADWDPNYRNTQATHELGGPLPDDDGELARNVSSRLGIKEEPRDVYRTGDEVEILFDKRTLHVNAKTGHVSDDEQKPRFLLRVSNWLHLNRGKKAWTYIADGYAGALLFLALSGMFMIAGKKGLIGRGAVFVAVGIAIPVVYVTLAS